MITRLMGSRGVLSVAVIVILAITAVVGFRLAKPTPDMRGYCALMPDSIGLFEGSAVAVMGMPVGRVTGIAPDGIGARVDFELPADRRLPADVGATTLADTLIADRKLAIIGTETTGAQWDPSHCITKTLTPKSLTQTFTAISQLADELNGAGDPAHPNLIAGGLTALQRTTEGRGDQINEIVRGLGSALDSPDAAIGHIGALIDTLSSLSGSAVANWAELKSALTRWATELAVINDGAIPPILEVVDSLRDLLPPVNDLTQMVGGPLLRRLDAVENLPQLISAGVGSLTELIAMVPVIEGYFTRVVDPVTHRVGIAYAPPRVAIPRESAEPVCALLNGVTPGGCRDASNGLVDIPLTQFVFGSVGGR